MRVAALRADGHEVTALTLPGLESADADRSQITLADHVDAICEAVTAAGRPVMLAVHSGAGASGYAASDRVPEQIAAMVYVDSGPATGALDPDFQDAEKPLPSPEELAAEENLDGLSEEQLDGFRRRAVPEPGGPIRDAPELTNDARLDVPTTAICTGYTSDQYKDAVKQGYSWLGGFAARHHLGRPADEPLADVVTAAGAGRDHRRRRPARGLSRNGDQRGPRCVGVAGAGRCACREKERPCPRSRKPQPSS